MPRKIRLEFPGAIYHVINRGNHKAWIFKQDGAKQSFEECVFDACEKNAWILHGFVIMGNHYHLAVQTPESNLVAGMQWLQSKFANRLNKLRDERGHVFQGRYKAILVEAGGALGEVCHYIHLNPVRAGVVPIEKLGTYRFSSYWFLHHPKERPARLKVNAGLEAAGELPDSAPGRKSYERYLAWHVENGPLAKEKAYEVLSRGWAIGSDAFKNRLLKDQKAAELARAWASKGAAEIRQRQWSKTLAPLWAKVTDKEKRDRRKSALWRIKIAAHMKATTGASNAWLAGKLNMGSPFYVSKHVGLFNKVKGKA